MQPTRRARTRQNPWWGAILGVALRVWRSAYSITPPSPRKIHLDICPLFLPHDDLSFRLSLACFCRFSLRVPKSLMISVSGTGPSPQITCSVESLLHYRHWLLRFSSDWVYVISALEDGVVGPTQLCCCSCQLSSSAWRSTRTPGISRSTPSSRCTSGRQRFGYSDAHRGARPANVLAAGWFFLMGAVFLAGTEVRMDMERVERGVDFRLYVRDSEFRLL